MADPRAPAALLALLALAAPAAAQRFSPTPQPASPAGVRAQIDLPTGQHLRNTGGSDGLGLCVFTSITHSARWQNVSVLDGYRRWMERRPGGGYPRKVDDTLAAYCRELGQAVPAYVQHTGGDADFLDLAVRTDRCPSVTYDGRDDFYRGSVAHMVNLAHLDQTVAAVIDNNRPGVWLWMSRADFLSRWRGNGGGWAVVLLDPPPPPHAGPPATVEHRWAGSPPCPCGGAGPCDCGPGCRCEPARLVGQCPGGRCPVPVSRQPAAPAAGPEPVGVPPSAAHEWGLFGDGRTWGWRFKLAEATPAGAPAAAEPPTGVLKDRVHDGGAEYTLSGRPVTRDEALAAVGGGGSLADDSDRWHLSAVGPPDLLARVKADVAGLDAGTRAKLLVQLYPPAAWPVAAFALPAGVSLRAPSPARTGAQLGAVGAAEYAGLTALLSLPGGPTPAPAPAPTPTPNPAPAPTPNPWVLILGGAVLWLLLRR